jgi:hypothetical protein
MWIQDVVAVLHGAFAFLSRQDFLVNFVANLGGALCGVLLAFWIEYRRTRRDTTNLYGRLLRTSRSELSYIRPMCAMAKDNFRAAKMLIHLGSLSVTATRALLVNPLAHEKAPYSLIMALTILSSVADATEDALRRARVEAEPATLEHQREL